MIKASRPPARLVRYREPIAIDVAEEPAEGACDPDRRGSVNHRHLIYQLTCRGRSRARRNNSISVLLGHSGMPHPCC
jgi:hypothetical protein